MKIFEKRPLCLILCIMLGGFSFSVNSSNTQIILLIIPTLLFIITLIKPLIDINKILITRIVSISLFLSLLLGILFTTLFFPGDLYYTQGKITGKVLEVTYTDTYQKIILQSDSINCKKEKIKFIYYNYDKYLNIGDYLEADINILPVETSTEFESLIYTQGVSAIADLDNINVIKTEEYTKNIFEKSRERITSKLISLNNKDTGGFISALLIGDQSSLDPSLKLSFQRLGLSHILALSGMNIALLTNAIERILYHLRVARKKRMLSTSLFTIGYMALVGFTPTITRAGIMLLVYYSLRILAHTSDSLTSLSLSVFLIVLINPCSIYDISLWLSAFATLGIVALSEIYNDKKRYHILLRPIHYFVNSIISSFFAITLTLFLTVKSFNTFSPVSLISTAIFSPIIDLYIYFGMLMPVLGWFIPLGKIAIPLTNFIKLLAEKMSSPWWVVARADNLSIKLLTVLISIIFVCFFIFDIKRKRPFIIASVGVMLATIILSTVLSANAIYKNRSVYTSNSTYDNVLITGNGTTTFIISENVTVRNMYYISDIASKNGICTINNLVFTCYSDKFNSLDRLINYVKTNTIYVPVPQNSIEIEKAKYLSNLLSAYGTTLRFYKIEETLSFSEVDFNLVYYSPAVNNRSFSCIYTLKKSDKTITYFSEQSHSIAPDTVLFDSEKSDEWILGVGSGRSDPYDIYLNTPNNIIVGRGGRIAPEIESEMLNDGVNITYTDNFTILFQ